MSPRPADATHGPGGRPPARTGEMPDINWCPTLADKEGDDIDEYGGGDLVYPKNGRGKDDPAG